MHRVTYINYLACNMLASYAASLKSQSNYIAENVANRQKI